MKEAFALGGSDIHVSAETLMFLECDAVYSGKRGYFCLHLY